MCYLLLTVRQRTSLEDSWNMPYHSLNVNMHENIFLRMSITYWTLCTFLIYCCVIVSKRMHHLFEANSWFLPRQDSIIEQYYASKDKPDDFPNINVCRPLVTAVVVEVTVTAYFRSRHCTNIPWWLTVRWGIYPSIVKPPAEKVDSSNLKAKGASVNDADVISAFETHIYPLAEFPAIISFVHPRFVLHNAGRKVFDSFLQSIT